MEDTTDCDSVAITVTPDSGAVAKPRQISADPLCALVRLIQFPCKTAARDALHCGIRAALVIGGDKSQ
jgi:hypothetical protein